MVGILQQLSITAGSSCRLRSQHRYPGGTGSCAEGYLPTSNAGGFFPYPDDGEAGYMIQTPVVH